ncbi:uncharacterized protein LOC142777401 isoform X2 [Rhipicephalus microplus]|uniref:uncharacterized protein LOC142777401 isoform X2 n=1 Tax=Rhipicephalus microplus TaxID=6941 RepID=UPI003F6B589C
MATLKTRLLLVVAYLASVAAVISVEHYWHNSGYQFSDLLSKNNYVSALLLVFAVIGICLSALIVATGLVNIATRALASNSCDGSCQHHQQRRQNYANPNNIDVTVQPTDTTIAELPGHHPRKSFYQSGAEVLQTKLARPDPSRLAFTLNDDSVIETRKI